MWRCVALGLLAIAATSCGASPAARPALSLRPCTLEGDVRAECGTVGVPEDRSHRGGRTISVHVAVVRGDTRGGPALFLLAGGPGQASAVMAAMTTGFLQPLRSSMDIVLVDQRGTDGKNPLLCSADIDRDPAAAFGHVLYPDVIRSCRESLSGRLDAGKYTTEDAVADLEEVRTQLGYPQVSLFGVSYGSRLAQAYVRRFPSRVRSAVLDGVAPLDVNLPLTMARSLQRSLDLVVGADTKASSAFASILRRLDKAPLDASVSMPDGRPAPVRMSRQDFLYSVRGILYQPAGAAVLPGLLTEAARTGRVDGFAQRYWQRARRLQESIAHGVHLSVYCAEDVPFTNDAEIASETEGTVLGRWLYDEYAGACRLWPSTPVGKELRQAASASVPVLLVSGHFDPVTPPEFGTRVARSLPQSRHIIVPDGAHGSAAGCPRPAVLHVLAKGTLEGMPVVCR